MTQTHDEWALPAATPGRNTLPGDPIRLFHSHRGRPYAFPLNVIAAQDDLFDELGVSGLLARAAPPNQMTVIIAVEEGMMAPVRKVLDELALQARNNAGFASVTTAAEHIERARAISDGRNGMLVHLGHMLRTAARAPARDAAETLFATAERMRKEQETRTPVIH